MGEYEDRYPDAYGRDENAARPPVQQQADQAMPPRQVRDAPLFGSRFGLGAAAETAPAWRHAPSGQTRPGEPEQLSLIEPTAPPQRPAASYRGLGPRGYVRSDQRIYEDICDRLTENAFIDASDIEVTVRDRTVILAGSVDSMIAVRQAGEIAREAVGVANVRNDLISRGDEHREDSHGDRVSRAMPPPRDR